MRETRNGNILLARVPPAERRRLERFVEVVRMDVGQTLLEMDRPIDYVWFPHDAVTSTVVRTEEGSFLEVGLMGAEGMVGLSLVLGETISNTTVIVQVAGVGSRMSARDFQREVVEPKGPLFQMIQKYCNAFMAMLAQSAVCNSMHAVDERMCRWILMTHDRVKRDEIALSHKFLAMMLGVRRAEVSRTAASLKSAALIDYTRDSLRILDRRAVEGASCDCYAVITEQMDRVFDTEWRKFPRK